MKDTTPPNSTTRAQDRAKYASNKRVGLYDVMEELFTNSLNAELEDAYINEDKTLKIEIKIYINSKEVEKIVFKDYGIGMTEENMNSLRTIETEHNINRFSKGLGRFSIIALFDDINIDSCYREDQTIKFREFKCSKELFGLKGIGCKQLPIHILGNSEITYTYTEITLSHDNKSKKTREWTDDIYKSIKEKILTTLSLGEKRGYKYKEKAVKFENINVEIKVYKKEYKEYKEYEEDKEGYWKITGKDLIPFHEYRYKYNEDVYCYSFYDQERDKESKIYYMAYLLNIESNKIGGDFDYIKGLSVYISSNLTPNPTYDDFMFEEDGKPNWYKEVARDAKDINSNLFKGANFLETLKNDIKNKEREFRESVGKNPEYERMKEIGMAEEEMENIFLLKIDRKHQYEKNPEKAQITKNGINFQKQIDDFRENFDKVSKILEEKINGDTGKIDGDIKTLVEKITKCCQSSKNLGIYELGTLYAMRYYVTKILQKILRDNEEEKLLHIVVKNNPWLIKEEFSDLTEGQIYSEKTLQKILNIDGLKNLEENNDFIDSISDLIGDKITEVDDKESKDETLQKIKNKTNSIKELLKEPQLERDEIITELKELLAYRPDIVVLKEDTRNDIVSTCIVEFKRNNISFNEDKITKTREALFKKYANFVVADGQKEVCSIVLIIGKIKVLAKKLSSEYSTLCKDEKDCLQHILMCKHSGKILKDDKESQYIFECMTWDRLLQLSELRNKTKYLMVMDPEYQKRSKNNQASTPPLKMTNNTLVV